MHRYRCWVPSDGQTAENGKLIDDLGSPGAAETFVEQNFARLDYPTEVEIVVAQYLGDDKPLCEEVTFVVTVESVPVFHARRKP